MEETADVTREHTRVPETENRATPSCRLPADSVSTQLDPVRTKPSWEIRLWRHRRRHSVSNQRPADYGLWAHGDCILGHANSRREGRRARVAQALLSLSNRNPVVPGCCARGARASTRGRASDSWLVR